MKLFITLILFFIYMAVVVGASIVGMIYGWGIEPKNWGWILFSYVMVIFPAALSAASALKN